MEFWKQNVLLVVFCVSVCSAVNSYALADQVQFQALRSGGFRAYIADRPEISGFKINGQIGSSVTIGGQVKAATEGFWVLYFNEALKAEDLVTYTIHVDAERLRYTKSDQVWQVSESDLQDTYPPLAVCKPASTTVNGKKSCGGKLIISDAFDGSFVNRTNWIVEHRIPTYETVNAEFNSYEDSDETRFVKSGILYIKPIVRQNEDEVRGVLNLRNGCTSTDDNQCYYRHLGAFLLPVVKSARVTTKASFKYGKVEIKAKLPAGDWIVPVMQLEPKDDNYVDYSPKIIIAYSRGNYHLTRREGVDIGSHLLYIGFSMSPSLPEENQGLLKRTANSNKPYCNDFHVYTLEWLPGTLSFYVDDQLSGTVDTSQHVSAFDKEFVLSLGVAVGGIYDFPDDCVSGNSGRPWDYVDRNYMKTFFDARGVWSKTWSGDNCALQIEHVKVWAI